MLAPRLTLRWPNVYCELLGSGYCQMMLHVEGDFQVAGAGVGVWANFPRPDGQTASSELLADHKAPVLGLPHIGVDPTALLPAAN
jgi:hypothetical protein